MFIIERLILDDSKLAKVLTLLAGNIVDMSAPRPLVNAEVKQGKVKSKVSGINIKDRMIEKISQRNGGLITTDELKLLLHDAGGAPTSLNNMTKDIIDAGVMERQSRGVFSVRKQEAA